MIKSVAVSVVDGEGEIAFEGNEADGYAFAVDGDALFELTEEEVIELRDALTHLLGDGRSEYDDGYADGWTDAMEQPADEELN